MRSEIRQLGCSARRQAQQYVNIARIGNNAIRPNYGVIHVAKLFPFYCSRRFSRNIVHNTINPTYFINNAIRHFT
jgi:hypothetical protein